MTLERILDEEVNALMARVEDAHGRDAVNQALERVYDNIVSDVRAKLKSGEVPDTTGALPAAFRRELEGLLRER